MLGVSLRAVGASATGTSSITVSSPISAVSGDILLAFIVDHATTGSSAAPTGWTRQGGAAGSSGRFQVFSAVVGQGSLTGTSWSFTGLTTRSQAAIAAYFGGSTTQLDTTVSARVNASGTTGTTAITTATATTKILLAFCSLSSGATWSGETATSVTGVAEQFDTANGGFCSLAIADANLAAAGSSGASSATMSANAVNAAILLALRCASTVATSTVSAATSITSSTATLNGNSTALGDSFAIDARGFVWGTVSQSPGNQVAPASSGYTSFTQVGSSGGFGTGAFSAGASSLSSNTTYFVRSWSKTGFGYAYSSETSFTTGTNASVNVTGVEIESYVGSVVYRPVIVLDSPADTSTVNTSLPTLTFTGTDPFSGALSYRVQISNSSSFVPQVIEKSLSSSSAAPFTFNLSSLKAAQSFLGDGNGVSNVSFRFLRSGTITGTLVVNIYGNNGDLGSGVPTGPILATSSTLDPSTISAFSVGLYNFTFSTPFVTTSDSIYWVSLDFSGATFSGGSLSVFMADTSIPIKESGSATYFNGTNWAPATSGGIPGDFIVSVGTSGTTTCVVDDYSQTAAGFTDVTNGANTDPFTSGEQISYISNNFLTNAATYYWRVKARAPNTNGNWGDWSSVRSFTVSTSTNASVNITGVSVTSSAGTVSCSGTANVTTTGTSLTSSAGTVAANVSVSTTVTGIATTSSAGTVSVTGTATFTPVGVNAAATAGTVVAGVSKSVNITGISLTGSAGTVSSVGAANSSPTGISLTSTAGTVTSSGIANVGITGVSSVSSAGTVSSTGRANVSPTGVSATASAGTVIGSVSIAVSVTGISITSSAGTVISSGTGNLTLTGVNVTSSSGTVIAGVSKAVAVTGIGLTSSTGTVTSTGVANTNLTGIGVVSSPGTVIGSVSVATTVTGVQLTSAAGTVTSSGLANTSITGVVSTSSSGTVTPNVSISVPVTGISLTSSTGFLSSTGTANTSISGSSTTSAAGTVSTIGTATNTLTGLSMLSVAGTLTSSGIANISLTGVAVTSSTGVVTPSVSINVSVTGLSLTSAAGTVSSVGDAQASLIGASLTSTAGTVSAGTSSNISVNVTGVSLTASAGTIVVTGNASVSTIGTPTTASAGIVSANVSKAVNVTGVQAASSTGTVISSGGATNLLIGIELTSAAGTISSSGSVNGTVSVSGANTTTSAGTIVTSGGATLNVVGVSATPQNGVFSGTGTATTSLSGAFTNTVAGTCTGSVSISQSVSGVSLTTDTGTVDPYGDASGFFFGVSLTPQVGNPFCSGGGTVILDSVEVDVIAGTLIADFILFGTIIAEQLELIQKIKASVISQTNTLKAASPTLQLQLETSVSSVTMLKASNATQTSQIVANALTPKYKILAKLPRCYFKDF